MDLGELNGPVLVFGGPYSNLSATREVKRIAEQQGIPAASVICTGDLVAYCADPTETVSLIQEWGCHVVMGNCEESLAASAPDCGCGFDEGSACSLLSVQWYAYANNRVSPEQKFWMGGLPRQLRFSLSGLQFHVLHGSVTSINEFIFASTDHGYKAKQQQSVSAEVIIGGHSGLPFVSETTEGYWLNAGVIGMPANDGTSDCWYMLLEPQTEGIKVSWHRLAYAVNETVASMKKAEISAAYAACLQNGLWPSLDILPEQEKRQTGKTIELRPILIR
jgi:predicted phosphodiesterase